MGEIRLICPGCEAEYQLAEDAIPPAGRTVECAACGNMWFAQPLRNPAKAAARAAASAPAPDTPLNRPLPDDVLAILREEAARERKARALDIAAATHVAQTSDEPPAEPKPSPMPAATSDASDFSDDDWPATTVTTPAPLKNLPNQAATAVSRAAAETVPAEQPRPVAAHRLPDAHPAAQSPTGDRGLDRATDSPARHIHRQPHPPSQAPAPEELAATVTRTTPSRAPAKPGPAAGRKIARTRAAATRYHDGFQWGLVLVLALLTLYVGAPHLADQGKAGAALMEARTQIDIARLWLFDHATALIDPLVAWLRDAI